MRNDHRMGGNMSEQNRPFDPTNGPPHVPDNPEPPQPAEAAIPGLDVPDDLACPLPNLQQPPRGRRCC